MSICSPLRGVSWGGFFFGGVEIDLDGGSTSLGVGLVV